MRAQVIGCLVTLMVVSGCSGSDADPDGGSSGAPSASTSSGADDDLGEDSPDPAPSPEGPETATGPAASITGMSFNLPRGWEVDEKTTASLLVASPASKALSIRGLSAAVIGTQGRPLDTGAAYDLRVRAVPLARVRRLPDETFGDREWFHLEGALGPATDVQTYGSGEGQYFGMIQFEFGSAVPRSEQLAVSRSVMRTVLLD